MIATRWVILWQRPLCRSCHFRATPFTGGERHVTIRPHKWLAGEEIRDLARTGARPGMNLPGQDRVPMVSRPGALPRGLPVPKPVSNPELRATNRRPSRRSEATRMGAPPHSPTGSNRRCWLCGMLCPLAMRGEGGAGGSRSGWGVEPVRDPYENALAIVTLTGLDARGMAAGDAA
jgi:hypothetical protein